MAYDVNIANKKTAIETLENAGAVLTGILASFISKQFEIELNSEQILILIAAIKILISRIRNEIKHRIVTKVPQ